MRAVIYVRVSTLLQANEDKVSIPEQIADCEQYAKEKGYTIVGYYVDKQKYKSRGKLIEPSGTRADRPEYLRMIRDGQAGKYDVIIAWKEDRLYRGIRAAMPLGDLLDERREDGKPRVCVELVKEAFDPRMLYLKASIGKIEIDNFRERSSMGVRGRLKKGLSLGGCYPYGFDRIDGKLVINELEADWVRKILWWYGVDKIPLTEIRRRLIENRVPQKGHSGKIKVPWSKSVLYGMLKGTYYYGEVTVNAAGQTWSTECPAIVEKWLYDRVQERLKASKSHPLRHYIEVHLLAGLLYCAACGHRMHGKSTFWIPKDGIRRVRARLYYCHAALQYPDIYTCRRHFGAKRLEATVWDLVTRALEHPALIREQIERKAKELEGEAVDTEQRIESLSRRLQQIQDERQWLIVQARKKIIAQAEFETQMNLLEEQRGSTETELQELKQVTTQRDEANRLLELANEFFANLRDGLGYLNQPEKDLAEEERRKIAEEKRRILQMVVTRIDLDQQGNLAIEGMLDRNVITAQIKSPHR